MVSPEARIIRDRRRGYGNATKMGARNTVGQVRSVEYDDYQ